MANGKDKNNGASLGFEARRFEATDKLCGNGQIAHDEAHAMHRA